MKRSKRNLHPFTGVVALLLTLILSACGGGGGDGDGDGDGVEAPPPPLPPITSFQLLDPTPGAGDQFGQSVVLLANGNIVVSDTLDSSVAGSNGAVHLYNPVTLTLIASIYGDTTGDQLGSDGITALANNNFVIVSSNDNEGGISNAGSVRLVDGTTGFQIGSALVGDVAGDQLGSSSITALANNNFVISSSNDNEGGISSAGSVRLVDGATGVQIGSALVGDVAGDQLGSSSITALANNNFVIVSSNDNEGGISSAGSVRLVNGATGVQIGSALVGDVAGDQLGSSGITTLANNNFVISSSVDDEGGFVDAGSVRLVNGATGVQINALVGNGTADQLSSHGITALANNNFVIASSEVDGSGYALNAGSVRLVNGVTGVQIKVLVGDVMGDSLGSHGITALANSTTFNFVIASSFDDEGGISDVGSVRLVNGATGDEIKVLVGGTAGDQLGSHGVTDLTNNNFVIGSADLVRLVDGDTGNEIHTLADGSGSITVLANNNFVVASPINHLDDNGLVRLVNGTTGVKINALVGGLTANLGSDGITALANNNFMIASSREDIDRAGERFILDGGTVRLVDGTSGVQIGDTIVGRSKGDMYEVTVTGSTTGDFYILGLPLADNNEAVDSGLVGLIAQ